MARYRVYQKNPITNEWVDKGWSEGESQRVALKAYGVEGAELLAVPENSWHPVRFTRVERVTWDYADREDEAAIAAIESDG